jgi:Flp pilus assembly protein CpaB
MTMTEQAARPSQPATPPPVAPRRTLHSRLSRGHLAMLLAALLAVLGNYAVLRAADDTTRVAIAAEEIRAGQPVTAAQLAFSDVKADGDVLATLLAPERLAAVEGMVARVTLAPGELVRASDLQPPSAPAGQRAMSIPVEPEHAVAGDLRAGDRVDVIEVDGRTATYLVTGAEVLAVPPTGGQGLAGGLRAFSVTIAVDDATALDLAVAIRSGQLEVVRSTGSAPAAAPQAATTPAGRSAEGDDG